MTDKNTLLICLVGVVRELNWLVSILIKTVGHQWNGASAPAAAVGLTNFVDRDGS